MSIEEVTYCAAHVYGRARGVQVKSSAVPLVVEVEGTSELLTLEATCESRVLSET
jgi:hypothetical protein